MLQGAVENKYRFHMQVSARAISASHTTARSRKRLKKATEGAKWSCRYNDGSQQRVFQPSAACFRALPGP
jgi:hypothetical protein